ncbi:MAG: Hsp20/alpha crystallin family protein [Lachnospiraceae bacterium]|nr:Hsp20/alpha crystallin family protein [Lachnospiraceae bacterium]
MLYPSIFSENLFDDFMNFDFPSFRNFDDVDKKLYGKHAAHVMKTDVREHEDGFDVDIDLPGFKKDEINLELENGYLTVSAAKGLDKDEKDKKGRVIRQERYAGAMKRSFYIGEYVKEEDIKAKFEDGVLKLAIPKKTAPKVEEKKTIMIEG